MLLMGDYACEVYKLKFSKVMEQWTHIDILHILSLIGLFLRQ